MSDLAQREIPGILPSPLPPHIDSIEKKDELPLKGLVVCEFNNCRNKRSYLKGQMAALTAI